MAILTYDWRITVKNNMLKKVLIALIMCVMSITMVACGGGNIEAPSSSATIIGNGGMSVQKGEYIYFANGYQGYSVINTDNRKDANYINGGLYVAKLDESGNVLLNDDGTIKYVKRLVGSLVGYENTDLHIFGNYLYYNTPCTNLNDDGTKVASDLIRFCRIKLDGSDQEVLLTSDTSTVQYAYYYDGAKVNLMTYENNTLKRTTIGKSIDTNTISTDVTSVGFPEVIGNPMADTSAYQNIYYTANLTEDESKSIDSGNKLIRYNAKTNKSDIEYMLGDTTTIKAVTDRYLYATINDNYTRKVSLTTLHAETQITSADFTRVTSHDYTPVYYVSDCTPNGLVGLVVVRNNNVYFLQDGQPANDEQTLIEGSTTIVDVVDGTIYYTDSNATKLYSLNIKNKLNSNASATTIYAGDMKATFDLDHIDIHANHNGSVNYVFMMLENTNDNGTSTYTYRVNLDAQDDEGQNVVDFVGVYRDTDIPEKEEEQE